MVEGFVDIPELEQVAERVPYITMGRIARKLSVEVMKRFLTPEMVRHGLLPIREVQDILAGLPQDEDAPWKIVKDHLIPVRDRLFLVANIKAHPDMWMRDFKFTSEFIDDPLVHDNILKTFEDKQRPNGQIPTAIGIWGSTPWHFADDESTLLYVISAAELAKHDRRFLTDQRKEKIEAALGFVEKHVFDGRYVSPPGDRRGWVDAFIYPRSDVNTHTQGLYAVALMSLGQMGYADVPTREVHTAKEAYRNMAEPHGYLPLSARFPEATDATTLYPEYLAITSFGENLLPDSTVENTIKILPWSRHGIKVLTASPKGDYFDPSNFTHDLLGQRYQKGDYQNGGVWPLWHNNALVVGKLHGMPIAPNFGEALLTQMEIAEWPEYIKTGGEYEHKLTPMRPWHVWNVAIIPHQRALERVLA